MKKFFTILVIILFSVMGGEGMEPLKSKSISRNSTVIASFTLPYADGGKVDVLPKGKLSIKNRSWTGSYTRKDNGNYYILYLGPKQGDGIWIYLMTKSAVYLIDAGSDGYVIEDFIYNPATKTIKVLLDSEIDEKEWREARDFDSVIIPLSNFVKVYPVKWLK